MGDACCGKDAPVPADVDATEPDLNQAVRGQDRPLLTPEDVHHKWFPTVRLREGYDLGAVDTFLYDVETTLGRLHRDNQALQEQLGAAPLVVPQQPQPQPVSDEVARVMALAEQAAGESIAAARTEAAQIVARAQARAQTIEREARARADRTEHEAMNRAFTLDQGLRKKHQEYEATEKAQRALEGQLAGLRGLVNDYRRRMTANLEDHFGEVEGQADGLISSLPTQRTALSRAEPIVRPMPNPPPTSGPPNLPDADGWPVG